ncbi:YfiR family protein [Labilibacter marinus]|uniref:YfiR family protein n=1 Tax=Labilibacter marinus TaxID=1477105 RepID=UPI0009FA4F0A|nr:YfiR family protein [Labilibacter marinus]
MLKKGFILLVLVFMTISVPGQQSMFKALFMFNFAKYIEWPASSNQTEFVIGVYGNDEIITELKKLAAARKINNKSIVVKSVKSPSEAGNAHIFYIPPSKSGEIDKVTSFFTGKSTLIVSDKDGLCKKGAGINYVMQGGKMKFEVNKANIIKQKLKVDPKLISLGIEIK